MQLTEEIGKLEDKVECANNALKADWERWRQNMRNDIKSAFSDMAERNIQYYEQVIRDLGIASSTKLSPLSLSVCPVLEEY